MHMADALLSPAVGGTMWAVSAGAIACSSRLCANSDDRKAPLMGVMGAFLFAAQLINFSIPGTGSSGHLGGGLLLAILLGPAEAFLTVASVLVMQALLFADGGLLALGCNIFNLGFIPAFVVFPLYQRMIGSRPGRFRRGAVTILSAIVALQLGAFAVVTETCSSGISSIPFSTFLLLMQPIHLAIGIVEGAATTAVVSFITAARPGMLEEARDVRETGKRSVAAILMTLTVVAVAAAGGLSLFASQDPDGLEWSVAKVTGKGELRTPTDGVHRALARLQKSSARFPDYQRPHEIEGGGVPSKAGRVKAATDVSTGAVRILGTLLTLVFIVSLGLGLQKRNAAAIARSHRDAGGSSA